MPEANLSEVAPYSRDEVIAALEGVHREVEDYFHSLSAGDFVRRPEEEVWSPAENLIHLVKSVQAVSKGLDMPRLLLAILFRRPKGVAKSSRPFAGVVEIYHEQLARGGRAGGPYLPPRPAEDAAAAEASQSRALAGWNKAGITLVEKVGKWNEKSLDRYRLPHPLIGNLTVREMLFFTLYHDRHHLESVQKRLATE